MKVAIHQPNFLPWPGYFHKYASADLMVHMDTVQHVRGDFDHRNWIKTPAGTKLWIIVHIAGGTPHTQSLNKVPLASDDWREKISRQLYNSYRRAPYYQPHADNLMNIISREWPSLAHLNLALIDYLREQVVITTPSRLLSEFESDFGRRSERLINICRYLGADTYLSGTGALAVLDENLFHAAGINVEYQVYKPITYTQLHGEFVPNLSIVDLLFNTGPQARHLLMGE